MEWCVKSKDFSVAWAVIAVYLSISSLKQETYEEFIPIEC